MSALSDLSAALLPPDAGGPNPHRVASAARILLDGMPARQRVGVGVGLAAIQAIAVATKGKRLGAMPSEQQSAFLERIATSGPLGSAAMDALKTLVLMGAGGDEFAPEIRSVGSSHAAFTAGSSAEHPPRRRTVRWRARSTRSWSARGRGRVCRARACTRRLGRPDRRRGRALDIRAHSLDASAGALRLALSRRRLDDRARLPADRSPDGPRRRRHDRGQLGHLLPPARTRS